MELSDKAYSSMIQLKRSSFLMEGLESATDETLLSVCKEIVEYLDEKINK